MNKGLTTFMCDFGEVENLFQSKMSIYRHTQCSRSRATNDRIGELNLTLRDGHIRSQVREISQSIGSERTIEREAHCPSIRIHLILQTAERCGIVTNITTVRLIDSVHVIVRNHNEKVESCPFESSLRQQHCNSIKNIIQYIVSYVL